MRTNMHKQKKKNKVSPTNAPDTNTDAEDESILLNNPNPYEPRSKSVITEKVLAPSAAQLRHRSLPAKNANKLGDVLTSIMEESNGDNEVTTFQRQLSTFRFSNASNKRNLKNDIDSRKNTYMRMLSTTQNRGNTMMEKISNVFGGKELNTMQMRNMHEADTKFAQLKRNSRIIIQITRDNVAVLPPFLLHPESTWRAYWDVFMLLLVCYYALVTPINISFDESPFDINSLEVVFNCCFILDIFLQFFTSYKHEVGPNAGRLEVRHRVIVLNYLKKWFLIDFVASFPVGAVVKAATGSAANLSLNKLLRLVRSVKLMRILRMSRIWKRLLHKVKINPSVVRLFKLFGFLIIEWHWIGCMYWAIAVSEGFDELEDPNAWTPTFDILSFSFPSQYIRAYFWAVMVTTGVGKDIIPETDVQYLFTTCAIIVGVLMYAVIVGSVGTALQSIDTPDSQKRRRIEAVREYLRQRDVTDELTEKILNYYDYCYTRHITENDDKVLTEIHSALKEKLDLEVNQQLLTKVPRFNQLPDGLLLVLIHSMESRIYLPNELVYLIGEKACEMFFIVRGDIEKLNRFGTTQEFLTDGDCFGDKMFKPGARRVCTIRCITHCELLILTRDALNKIMKYFPEFAMMVQKWSGENIYNSKHGWDRVRYTIKTLRYMKMMGAKVTFMDVVKYLNGELMDSQKQMLQRRKSIKNCAENEQIREMSHEEFHSQMADVFNAFDHILPQKEDDQQIQKASSLPKVAKFFGDNIKLKQARKNSFEQRRNETSPNKEEQDSSTEMSSPFFQSEA